ncbi:hypothetical protein QQP08_020187 [Theobroma cacao]|nr:hypothetical protein QQP08_020187 [Theobroma cacao]
MLPSEQWPMHESVTSWLLILFSFWVQWPTFPTLPIVQYVLNSQLFFLNSTSTVDYVQQISKNEPGRNIGNIFTESNQGQAKKKTKLISILGGIGCAYG